MAPKRNELPVYIWDNPRRRKRLVAGRDLGITGSGIASTVLDNCRDGFCSGRVSSGQHCHFRQPKTTPAFLTALRHISQLPGTVGQSPPPQVTLVYVQAYVAPFTFEFYR